MPFPDDFRGLPGEQRQSREEIEREQEERARAAGAAAYTQAETLNVLLDGDFSRTSRADADIAEMTSIGEAIARIVERVRALFRVKT
jgi:hypothetical protein